jgi:hydrogenase maturation protease
MRIFCFGNPLVKDDKLPLYLAEKLEKKLQNIEFVKAYSIEDVEAEIEGKEEIIIMDTVIGLKKIELLDDRDIAENRAYSLHDLDIGFFLKLMKKMGKIKCIKIIGIPKDYDKKKAIAELKKILNPINLKKMR